MTKKHWLLLFVSAVLYALPFIFSSYLWWLVFIFPIPLFYLALQEKLSFKHGYAWGIPVFGLHMSGVLYAIFLMSQGSYISRLIPAFFIVLYEALFAAIIFWFTSIIINWLQIPHKSIYRVVLWVIALWAFIHFVDCYCLWAFVRKEGYFLMHPLLPLATKPQLLQLLPIIGKHLLTLLLLTTAACITVMLQKRNGKAAIISMIALLPWIISWFTPLAPVQLPDWLFKVRPFPVIFHSSFNLTAMANTAARQFKKVLIKNPHVELIVMPESSFYCNNLSTTPELTALWNEQHLGRQVNIIVGAFRWENNKYYNSMHWIRNGTLQTCFDKRHAMLLVEHVPTWFDYPIIRDLYFKSFPEITPSQKPRPQLQLLKETAFVPYICSELFFNENPDDTYPNTPILAICNDSWFKTPYYPPYVQSLMYLVARFKAIQWHRNILYVAFSRAAYMDYSGNEITFG